MALTIPDQTIALQARAPDGMANLSSLLNVAGSAQALKKAQATYDSDVSQRAAESSSAQSRATVDSANVNPLIAQQAAITDVSETGAKSAKFNLQGNIQDRLNQVTNGLISDPAISSGDPKAMIPKLLDAKRRAIASGVPEDMAEVGFAHMITSAMSDPAGFPQVLKNSMLQSMAPTAQAGAIAPSGVGVSNGQQTSVINTNPLAPGGVGQPIPGTQQQQQLPPTTPTMVNGVPGYLGPQGDAQGGFDPSKLTPQQKAAMLRDDPQAYANGIESFYKRGQQGRVANGLPIGAADAIAGTQGVVNDDWKTSVGQAKNAQQTIGILQNIKQYSAGAAGGIGADRQAFTAGLAGLLGMDAGELIKTNTDLLAKNSNMLSLAGGNTDAARAMAEAANPNSHMTKEALAHAADQLIGQQQLNLARVQYLTPFKAQADAGHPEMYQAALNQFNSVADPRVVQFSSMSPEEKSAMKSSMSEKERADFGAKLGKARTLGIAQ